MTRTSSGATLPSIDGVRAIAVLLVVLGHSQRSAGFPAVDGLAPLGDLANLGVRLFFVVSGFLITYLLLVEERKTGTVSLKKFYLRRALRIFPAFYAFLLVIGVATLAGWIVVPAGDFVAAATYTMNFVRERAWYLGHTWSLAVEEQFYLLWPWLFVAASATRRRRAIVAVLVAAPLVRVATWALLPEWQRSIGETFPTIADALGTGVLLALVREQLHASARYARLLASPAILWLALAALVLNKLNGMFSLPGWLVGETALNLTIALLLDRVVTHPVGAVARLLNTAVAGWIGRLSYSIYLWQQPMFARDGGIFFQRFPFNVLCAGAMAYASYRLVERPFLKLKDRIGGSVGRKAT